MVGEIKYTKEERDKIMEFSKKLEIKYQDLERVLKTYQKIHGTDFDETMEHFTGKAEIEILPMVEAAAKQEKSEKIATGFHMLDSSMGGGISNGSSVVIAAPPGEGKTAFLVTLSYYFLKDSPCLWFSYEENLADIWERFKLTGVKDSVPAFCPLDITDNKLNYIERVIKKFKKENDFFVAFIDQLSFLAPKVQENSDIDKIQGNYSMYLGLISNQIKELAMKYSIIIVVAHQLGRSGDVAYSDMVKHAPDKVIYLKREPAPSNSPDEFTEKTFVIFKKNRPHGSRPRLAMTVKNGIFVPLTDTKEYATGDLGWKEEDSPEILF